MKMKEVLLIEGRREGYAISQIDHTMTVGDLIEFLEQFNPDAPVYLNNDNRFTFGSIMPSSFEPDSVCVDDDDEEDE